MSKNHLDHPVIGVFDDTYPVPDDQLAFEFALRDDFALRFPESVGLLNDALAHVQRVSGITIPMRGISDPGGELRESGLIDEQGYFVGRPDWCRIRLGLERSDLEVGDELPEPTLEMLIGMYSLLGASVEADGFWEGERNLFRREATRKGFYHAVPIYTDERYQLIDANQSGGGCYTYSVSVYNEADVLAMQRFS